MTTPRQFARYSAPIGPGWDVVDAIRHAFGMDGAVDILDERAGIMVPTFRLHRSGPAAIARTPDGRCLAVTVDVMLAIVDAFAVLDREALEKRPIRRRKAARQPSKGAPA